MKMIRNMVLPAIVAVATVAAASVSYGTLITTPVTGWALHNGLGVVADSGTDSPTFTPGDNQTIMASFGDIKLAADGDYVKFTTTLTMTGRTTTGVNTLNTQIRLGLFNGPAGPVVAADVPNTGLLIEYTNAVAGGLIREQASLSQTNPFNGPTNIGNGSADTDSIAGANPPPVTLEMTLTRNGGELDLTGLISGGSHSATFSALGHSSATFPLDGEFNFNRVGIFLGDGVNGATAFLTDATITTNVPEPGTCMLAALAVAGVALVRRRATR